MKRESAIALTRGANDSIARLFAFVFWVACKRYGERM